MIIYTVHPADKDLNFLKKVNEAFEQRYRGRVKYLKLKPNHKSHEDCINELMQFHGLVFFFCHALEKSIRGCSIKYASSQHESREFHYGAFISPSRNIEVFKGKKVFCLACNSSDLGTYAIDAGAQVFLGFGDVPFFIKEGYKQSVIEAAVKRELSTIIYDCLCLAIDNNLTFNELAKVLCISFNKRRLSLLSEDRNGRNIRIQVANVLSRIKNGIKVFGDGDTSFK
jgi:hypothetical protein